MGGFLFWVGVGMDVNKLTRGSALYHGLLVEFFRQTGVKPHALIIGERDRGLFVDRHGQIVGDIDFRSMAVTVRGIERGIL